tara:strand:- start:11629 stop:12396 length:768 start_codon:yes stop_codon:yes gene_type:complete
MRKELLEVSDIANMLDERNKRIQKVHENASNEFDDVVEYVSTLKSRIVEFVEVLVKSEDTIDRLIQDCERYGIRDEEYKKFFFNFLEDNEVSYFMIKRGKRYRINICIWERKWGSLCDLKTFSKMKNNLRLKHIRSVLDISMVNGRISELRYLTGVYPSDWWSTEGLLGEYHPKFSVKLKKSPQKFKEYISRTKTIMEEVQTKGDSSYDLLPHLFNFAFNAIHELLPQKMTPYIQKRHGKIKDANKSIDNIDYPV